MKKRFLYLPLLIATLILEILPYGAVCVFAPSPTETVRETFSYFDPLPFGYANFAPLLTAIVTCAILALLVVYLFTGERRVMTVTKVMTGIAVLLSLCPLVLGVRYYSVVGAIITLSLVAELLVLHGASKRNEK